MNEEKCFVPPGGKIKGGYVRAQYKGRQILAHRLAYCLSAGIEPDAIKGVVIRHKCDNPSCANPAHLEPGTPRDNMNDMAERGRRIVGEASNFAVLTEAQVMQIRSEYVRRSKHQNQYAIAQRYGVSQSAVSMIVNAARWSHLAKEAK